MRFSTASAFAGRAPREDCEIVVIPLPETDKNWKLEPTSPVEMLAGKPARYENTRAGRMIRQLGLEIRNVDAPLVRCWYNG